MGNTASQLQPVEKKGSEASPLQFSDGNSWLFALMKAVEKDRQTLETSMPLFAKAAEIATAIGKAILDKWNNKLEGDAQAVSQIANEPEDKYKENGAQQLANAQEQYNLDSAKAQSEESQQDQEVQGSQQQVSAISSDEKMKVQMVTSVSSVLSTLTTFLGRIT